MTQGICAPNGEGRFWPNGDFDGWEEGLKAYYDTDLSDAEKLSMGMQDRFSLSKFAAKFTKDNCWLAPAEQPKRYRTYKKVKDLAALIKTSDRMLAVSKPLKNVIEKMEPGVHQFWPMAIVQPDSTEYPTPYYGMVVQTHLDAFRAEQSDKESWHERSGRYRVETVGGGLPKRMGGIAMSAQVIGGAHLWREKTLLEPILCLSDTLMAEISNAGLVVPKAYKIRDV